jgi:hypothetical protein
MIGWINFHGALLERSISRDAELEADDDLLIGPPPPAVVGEAASANEAERFEEVNCQFRHVCFLDIFLEHCYTK